MSDFDEIFGGNGFDAGSNAADGDIEPLPAGDYELVIEEAKLCTTKDGAGKYLKIKFRSANNRVLWTNINILNKSAQAQQIGRRQLGKLSLAIGKPTLRDSSELIGCSCTGKVTLRRRTDGTLENEVKEFRAGTSATGTWAPPANAAAVMAPAQPAAPVAPPPPPARRPWEKKKTAAPAVPAAPAQPPAPPALQPGDGLPF